jgi:hypothetical protein
VDSCVITDLSAPASAWFEWSAATLERLDHYHTLVINPMIYAECSVGYERKGQKDNVRLPDPAIDIQRVTSV